MKDVNYLNKKNLKSIIYADNAATSPLSQNALEAMLPFMKNDFANASQPYSFAREARNALKKARETIAVCIGATPEDIYFTSGGTESNNWVIRGAIDFRTSIITSAIEHQSILRPAEYASKCGNDVSILPVTEKGVLEISTLMNSVIMPGSVVSIMTANNEIGTIQDIEALARYTHEAKGFFHTDAVQAIGHIGLDVKALGVDLLSASAHKFNGPKGIGFLYIRNGMKWPQLIYGGNQEFGYRAGTENIASIVGMATALSENIHNMGTNIVSIRKCEDALLKELKNLGVRYKRNGDTGHIPGNISLSFEGFEGEMLLHRLDLKRIMVSTGSACDNRATQVSHVLKAIGLANNLAKGTIRISLSHNNTVSESITIAKAIAQIVNESSHQCNEPIVVKDDFAKASNYTISEEAKQRYLKELSTFNVSRMYQTPAPHKPIYILTLIEAIRNGIIPNYRFQFTQELVDCFNRIWTSQVPADSKYSSRICRPAFYMSTSSFYRLKTWEGRIAREWQSPKSFAANYQYIEIDKDLYNLIRFDSDFINTVKNNIFNILKT